MLCIFVQGQTKNMQSIHSPCKENRWGLSWTLQEFKKTYEIRTEVITLKGWIETFKSINIMCVKILRNYDI